MGPYPERGKWRIVLIEEGRRKSIFLDTEAEALRAKAELERKAIHGQVCRTLAKVRERGLGWAEVAPLSDDELEALLYRPRSACAPTAPLPDWPWVETERRRPGVTLLLLHQEYRAQHPDGLGYSQFCDHYSRFQKERPLLMRQSYPAGDRLLSTTRSKKPSIWTRRPASASRASCLSRCWAPATSPTSRPPGRSAARIFYAAICARRPTSGGVARLWTPDNLKSAVSRTYPYQPTLQRDDEELATHYGACVLPACPRKPRDKAKVEVGVQIAQRWILARLRNFRCFSLAELNQHIARLLPDEPLRPT